MDYGCALKSTDLTLQHKVHFPHNKLTMVATTTQIAAAIACLTASSNAFSPSVGRAVVNKNDSIRNQPLFAEAPDGPKDGTTITSARKEIGYDAASGRFFETDLEDCSPDENEYCVVDKETGQLVSLTLEEKERIFLDSLQVSLISMQYWGFSLCIVSIICNLYNLYIIRLIIYIVIHIMCTVFLL